MWGSCNYCAKAPCCSSAHSTGASCSYKIPVSSFVVLINPTPPRDFPASCHTIRLEGLGDGCIDAPHRAITKCHQLVPGCKLGAPLCCSIFHNATPARHGAVLGPTLGDAVPHAAGEEIFLPGLSPPHLQPFCSLGSCIPALRQSPTCLLLLSPFYPKPIFPWPCTQSPFLASVHPKSMHCSPSLLHPHSSPTAQPQQHTHTRACELDRPGFEEKLREGRRTSTSSAMP